MPIHKPRLSRGEQARYLSVAREMVPACRGEHIPDEWQENTRSLRVVVAGSPESMIFQLSPSKVLYVLWVKLLAERRVTVEEFEIDTWWDTEVFACYPSSHIPYWFASALDFEFDKVLNHRIENSLRLRRGDTREGWLLAMSLLSVPEQYGRPGGPAPVRVTLWDQFGEPTVESVNLVVERSTRSKKPSVRPGPGLFEPKDASAQRERVMEEEPRAPVAQPLSEVAGPERRK